MDREEFADVFDEWSDGLRRAWNEMDAVFADMLRVLDSEEVPPEVRERIDLEEVADEISEILSRLDDLSYALSVLADDLREMDDE